MQTPHAVEALKLNKQILTSEANLVILRDLDLQVVVRRAPDDRLRHQQLDELVALCDSIQQH